MGRCANEEVKELPDLRNSALVTLVLAMVTFVLYISAVHRTRAMEVIWEVIAVLSCHPPIVEMVESETVIQIDKDHPIQSSGSAVWLWLGLVRYRCQLIILGYTWWGVALSLGWEPD